MADADTTERAERLALRLVVLTLLADQMERRPNLREELGAALDRMPGLALHEFELASATRTELEKLFNEAEEALMPALPPWPEEPVRKDRMWRRALARLRRIVRRSRR
jgi:hypothetical protein